MEDQSPYKMARPKLAIDPRELRRGNKVFYESEMLIGKIVTVATVENEGIRVFNGATHDGRPTFTAMIPFSDIQPVVLTEEIMQKTNLKKIEATALCEYDQWVDKNGEEIVFQADDHFCHSLIQTSKNELFFLHRLQNLYFALKQKELKIKL